MTTNFVGHPTIRLKTVDSTNKYAANFMSLSEWTEGTAILSEHQTEGRGRNNKNWNSSAGENLLMSLMLKPHFLLAHEAFQLSMAMALAVCSTVSSFGIDQVSVKWPNDIFVGDKKIAGILIENQVRGQIVVSSIVGIGLNVNQIEGFDNRATSFKTVLGNDLSVDVVFDKLCVELEKQYQTLRSNPSALLKAYNDELFAKGSPRVYVFNELQNAVLIGVERNGLARFSTSNGEKRCDIDSVKWVW
ncbi:MAG: biotin--[acetyl-CoA-carboxylase] ligase [Flavobacteriales bacterium]|nr:biotin--[acetyl-CoA-carboxylase] ligase [Flavobacteriales bacterium]